MDDFYETEDDLKRAVATGLRSRGLSSPSDTEWIHIWDTLSHPPYDGADTEEIVEKLIKLRPAKGQPPKRSSVKRPRRRQFSRLYSDEEQGRAEKASRERANSPEVVKPIEDFRRDVWGSDEPPFDDDSAAKLWLVPIPSTFATTAAFVVPMGPPYTQLEHVSSPWGVASRGVSQDSDQGRLKDISDRLCQTLGCFPAQAVSFLLTGQVPVVWPVTAEFPTDPGSITLHVNYPWVSPITVQRVYGLVEEMRRLLVAASLTVEQRQQMAVVTDKLHPRVVALMQFVSATRGLRWNQKRKAWNQQHPNWKYGSDSSMQVSLSQAGSRLEKTGVRLARLLAMFASREWEEKGYIRITRPPVSVPSPADVSALFDISKSRPH